MVPVWIAIAVPSGAAQAQSPPRRRQRRPWRMAGTQFHTTTVYTQAGHKLPGGSCRESVAASLISDHKCLPPWIPLATSTTKLRQQLQMPP